MSHQHQPTNQAEPNVTFSVGTGSPANRQIRTPRGGAYSQGGGARSRPPRSLLAGVRPVGAGRTLFSGSTLQHNRQQQHRQQLQQRARTSQSPDYRQQQSHGALGPVSSAIPNPNENQENNIPSQSYYCQGLSSPMNLNNSFAQGFGGSYADGIGDHHNQHHMLGKIVTHPESAWTGHDNHSVLSNSALDSDKEALLTDYEDAVKDPDTFVYAVIKTLRGEGQTIFQAKVNRMKSVASDQIDNHREDIAFSKRTIEVKIRQHNEHVAGLQRDHEEHVAGLQRDHEESLKKDRSEVEEEERLLGNEVDGYKEYKIFIEGPVLAAFNGSNDLPEGFFSIMNKKGTEAVLKLRLYGGTYGEEQRALVYPPKLVGRYIGFKTFDSLKTLTRAQYIRVIMILKDSQYDENESYVGHIKKMRDAGTCKQRRLADAFLQ